MSDKDLVESLDALIQAIKTEPVKPPFEIHDAYEKAMPYLSQASIEAIGRKASSQVIQVVGTMNSFQSVYMGVQVAEKNLEKALQALSADINALSALGLIHSTLAPPSYIRLARVPLQTPTVALFFYPLVPSNQLDTVMENCSYLMQEGQQARHFGSLEAELNEGEFLAELNISVWNLKDDVEVDEKVIQGQIDQYLAILPKGTKVLEINKCAIYSMFVPYEIKFYNPLMKRYKQVKLDYRREVARFDDRLEQFNLMTEATYIEK